MFSRISMLLVLVGAVFVFNGCSDDDEGPVAGNNNCLPTGNGSPPTITMLSWTQAPACAGGSPSLVTISVDVSDSDTDLAAITYVGSVTSCPGAINGAINPITCSQAGQYAGEVRLTDPEGNYDRVSFTFGPCENGLVVP